MKTYIDTNNLISLAKSQGCNNRDDVKGDINELSSSTVGTKYIWFVAKNGTILQRKNNKLNLWFDRYRSSSLIAYELIVEPFDEVIISQISLEQAKIDLNLAA